MRGPIAVILFFIPLLILGNNFEKYFVDKTLRVDYIFAGNKDSQFVVLDNLIRLPGWYGRQNKLSESILDGNGQIAMYDYESKECIYKNTFSTLFQEWLTTPEAETLSRSFENTFLLPYPKGKVEIKVNFRNDDGNYIKVFSHIVDPEDILIRTAGYNNITPYREIHKGGETGKCINVAIVAEGFTGTEMDVFRNYALEVCDHIFSHSPFEDYKDKFNFFAVECVSENSGVSIPRDSDWKKTAISSHFDTFYSDRYLTTSNVKDIHDILAGIPYQHIIILANTATYGGGGIFNAYTLTTTGHADFKPVVVHEFGHSFAGLADEYYYENDVLDNTYPLDVEPWEQNITTLVDFGSKWKNMLSPGTPVPTSPEDSSIYKIGVYEGGGYKTKGIYRANIDCRMKTNTSSSFCPVCKQAIENIINFYTE